MRWPEDYAIELGMDEAWPYEQRVDFVEKQIALKVPGQTCSNCFRGADGWCNTFADMLYCLDPAGKYGWAKDDMDLYKDWYKEEKE